MSLNATDFSDYPAAPFLVVSKTLDLVCSSLQCQNWRDHVPVFREQLSYKVGSLNDVIPTMMTYSEFLNGRPYSWHVLREFALETPSTSLSVLTTPTAMLVLFLLVLLIRAIKSVLLPFFSSLGRRAGRATHGAEWEAQNEIRIVKFGEYVFKLLFHFGISAAGIYAFWNAPWWRPGGTSVLWLGLPFHPVSTKMQWYYLVQSAYNLDALYSLLELSFAIQWKRGDVFPRLTWSNTVRGDFREMLIHHVVTNLLVIGSSHFRLTRIGSMVFLVHDISDVPVDLSKLANFLKYKTATAICFASMCVTWLIFRLGIFPFVIYKSVLLESHLILEDDRVDPLLYFLYRPFFYYLVGQIILLHVCWFGMFLKMGFLLVKKGETHDLSEHKSGETQGAPKLNGTKRNGHASNGASSNGHASNGANSNGHANGTNGDAMNGHASNGNASNGKNKVH